MDAHDIFKAPTRTEAELRLEKFVEQWQPLEPRAVKNFTWGLKRCFEFYEFDKALHPLIHSTNFLERFFREFRAKANNRITPYQVTGKSSPVKGRTANGCIQLGVPTEVAQEWKSKHTRKGKPIHRADLLNNSDYEIMK